MEAANSPEKSATLPIITAEYITRLESPLSKL
jgi:hypothetical protein